MSSVVWSLQTSVRSLGRFSVAIPCSVVSDTPHLREKTAKLGAIARACSIFGVHEVILYEDNPRRNQAEDMKFCSLILEYLETPQYLRKTLFKLSPALRYVGIVPPLQTPPHNVPRDPAGLRAGDLREGVIVSRIREDLIVDAGLQEGVPVSGNGNMGERVTLRMITVGKRLRGRIESSENWRSSSGVSRYWGYRVNRMKSIGKLLQDRTFDLKIGTSRYGSPIAEVWPSLITGLKTVSSLLVAFGSPSLGLREILQREDLDPTTAFDYFVNTAPNQQTATVRTEEALLVSLSILNLAHNLS